MRLDAKLGRHGTQPIQCRARARARLGFQVETTGPHAASRTSDLTAGAQRGVQCLLDFIAIDRQIGGGRPAGFDKTIYKRRSEVDRTINRLENLRAVATRYERRAYALHGTVTVAAIWLWLRP